MRMIGNRHISVWSLERVSSDGRGGEELTSFLIIDDHPLFREALGNAVRLAHPDARIFEAMSIKGALGILAAEQGIDLALLDLIFARRERTFGLSAPARNLSPAPCRDRLER